MRHLLRPAVLLAAIGAMSAPSALATGSETLDRRAGLGIGMSPPERAGPPTVDTVFPGLTGEKLGLRKGDVILAVGERPALDRATVVAYAGTLRANDPVQLRIRRNGRELLLAGRAVGRPLETYPGGIASYGSLPFRGGLLRDILVTPATSPSAPVVFLLPGYTCNSIEPQAADHPYRRLGAELIARGIGYYRVEKPFVGDSKGPNDCNDIDFATELDAFRSAYNHVITERGISADRIFMFGHSLGGLQAPLLAVEQPPRGVAVFGTVLRNWADYHHDVDRIQAYLFAGSDPVDEAAEAEGNRDLIRAFYFERKSPAEIAATNPQAADRLRELFQWDGGTRAIGGRSYRFNQDLAHLPLIAAWRDARTNVLALYGESDIVAINDEDHRLIADIASFYRPGTGRFLEVAKTDHGMELTGTRSEVREKFMALGQAPTGPFNPAVVEALASWISDAMAQPPVATRSFSPRTRPVR